MGEFNLNNWLLIVVGVFILLTALNGYRRGLLRSAFSIVSLVIVMVFVSFASPYVGVYVKEHTPIYSSVEDRCREWVDAKIKEKVLKGQDMSGQEQALSKEQLESAMTTGDQMRLIENLRIPEVLKLSLSENNNKEVYKALGVDNFSAYIAAYMASGVVNAGSYLLVFFFVGLILKLLMYVLDVVAKLPVLRGINRLGGLLFGAGQGLVAVWIGFLIITVIYATPPGQNLMNQIHDSEILSYLYNHNYLVRVVTKLF